MDHILVDDFGDHGDYARDHDKEHYIDNDGFREFAGHSDLFDDFLWIMASYADDFDMIYKHVMKFRSYRKFSYNRTV